jgi:hypothetical protein
MTGDSDAVRARLAMALTWVWALRLTHSYFRREEWKVGFSPALCRAQSPGHSMRCFSPCNQLASDHAHAQSHGCFHRVASLADSLSRLEVLKKRKSTER